MPQQTNCQKVHPNKDSGPCISCGSNSSTNHYVHLLQKKDTSPEYFLYVKEKYGYDDTDCICRKCDTKFRKLSQKPENEASSMLTTPAKRECIQETETVIPLCSENDIDMTTDNNETDYCFLHSKDMCDKIGDQRTSVNTDLFQSCFDIVIDPLNINQKLNEISTTLCIQHYKQYKKYKLPIYCCICEKNIQCLKSVKIACDKLEVFKVYLRQDVQVDKNVDADKALLCNACYKSFYNFMNSGDAELATAKTDQYLKDCSNRLDKIIFVSARNIDSFSYHNTLDIVVQKFLQYEPVLLPKLYLKFKVLVHKTVDNFSISDSEKDQLKLEHEHDARWLFTMLKTSLGHALQVYSPPSKKSGRMIYRLGSDLLHSMHSCLLKSQTEIDTLTESNTVLHTKINTILADSSLKRIQHLDDSVSLLKKEIKSYIQESQKSKTIPNIHSFDIMEEIEKISPTLWNFIFRLTTNDDEEKIMRKDGFRWKDHFVFDSAKHENLRLFPRLFIASCLFNTTNSHCTQPLHLLLTDVVDKYTNSSTDLLTINARLGAGISKESLKRFINNRCSQIKQDGIVACESFTIASFDNLDKNQSYALVGSGKEKSGFHGTTIQTVIPAPSEKCHPSEILTADSVNLSSTSQCFTRSNERTVSYDLVKSLKEPVNKIGEPSLIKSNKFCNLKLKDFEESVLEKAEWTCFENVLTTYGFIKQGTHEKNVIIPGLKTYLAHTNKCTEKSSFQSVAVLEDPADSKETILKTLNILHEKFQIGERLQYLVVVGDGKSYDHLIKIKSKYGCALDWVLAYPGDWHILKNLLPIFIKIYYDAGLKELASKYHKGATLKVLIECTKFSISNRFFITVWEAIFRYQIKTFLNNEAVPNFQKDFEKLTETVLQNCNLGQSDDELSEDILDSTVWTKVLESKLEFESIVQTVLDKFTAWRMANRATSDTFRFWDTFVHVDFMSYLGLYLGIRSRNWHLRNVSLKKLACLFYAFDRHNYLRMIPYHLADLNTFPKSVLDHFQAGCFAASISGENFYSVAADEAHEMEINLKTKQAIHSFNPSSLTALTYYLPYRAETLHNLKSQLCLEKGKPQQHRETTKPHIKSEEFTIRDYIDKLQHSSVLFKQDCQKSLVHIFSEVVATQDQTDSLINYREYGELDMRNYITCFLIKVTDGRAKQPARKRRNLKTFSSPKVTVHNKKKEIKDNQTVITCLRKKIAFSKLTKEPVSELDQFISLPRAISDANGIPEKGQKSLSLQFFRNLYGGAFINTLPSNDLVRFTTVILEGMFIINTLPLPMHKTFKDYSDFLFSRWIVRSHDQYKAFEVHVVFDHPNRHGVCPKDIERTRRDKQNCHVLEYKTVDLESSLPSNWRNFLAVREQKRKLVNFLSFEFLKLAQKRFQKGECLVITAGGFDEDNKDKAFCSSGPYGINEAINFTSNHEEGDTRVWLHASQTQSDRVIIYSPDTDTSFIGLPLIRNLSEKSVFIHLKESSSFENEFIHMNHIISLMSNDILLQGLCNVEKSVLMTYIISGCDFVSYFRGYGKKTFFECFRRNAQFITTDLHLCNTDRGLMAFYKLILCIYFSKHKTAFLPSSSVADLYNNITEGDELSKLIDLIKMFREKMWERVVSEDNMLPNAEALKLHWVRCCWVYKYWEQSLSNNMKLQSVEECGWAITENELSVIWDTDKNVKKVNDTIQWYTKGCSCKSGCITNRCSCKRSKREGNSGYCGPGCKCQNCVNVPNINIQELVNELEPETISNYDEDDIEDSDIDEIFLNDEVNESSTDDVNFALYWDTLSDMFGSQID